MEICHHIVKTSEVIGIGELLLEMSRDEAERALYHKSRFSFEVHLRCHTFTVTSPWFRPGNASDHEEKKQTVLMEQYREMYRKVKLEILELIK